VSGLFHLRTAPRVACAVDATDPIYLDLFHKVPLKRLIHPAWLLPEGMVMLGAIVDFSIIIGNLGGVLGLSGLLMLNYVFPSAADGCPAWAKPLFQILVVLGAIVVMGVLIQNADQLSPGAWASAAFSPPHS